LQEDAPLRGGRFFYQVITVKRDTAQQIDPEDIAGPEWAEWYSLSPAERWRETAKLWATFLALGGSLDPEPDTQSPFFDEEAPCTDAAHGRAGVHIVRRR
jgi:hypothetical protein